MKDLKLTTIFFLFLVFFISFEATNCKKSNSRIDEALIGRWISNDLVDTLEFTTNHDLFKMINGVHEHYNFQLSGDSILITYMGLQMPYIYLPPSVQRFYQLNGNKLTIDFSNSYFGFRNQIIELNKK